jgi:hypothetical protein
MKEKRERKKKTTVRCRFDVFNVTHKVTSSACVAQKAEHSQFSIWLSAREIF